MIHRLGFACVVLLMAASAGLAQPGPAVPSPGAPSQATAPIRPVGLISGGIDGTYVRIAADMAAVLDDGARLRIVPMLGKGSVQNIDDLLHLRGVDIAIVQSDVLAYIRARRLMPGAERAIGYIAKLYDEEVHVLAGPGIGRLADLAGKAVNVDVRGSGTALTASTLFESLGVAIRPVNDDQATALDKLRRGEIAALVYVAGKPARLFSGIDPASGLHFVAVPLTPALLENYVPASLEAADYPGMMSGSGPVETVAVGAVLATFAWAPGSDGHKRLKTVVDALFANFQRFRQTPRHPKWREVNLNAQVPGWTRFQPVAERLRNENSAVPFTPTR